MILIYFGNKHLTGGPVTWMYGFKLILTKSSLEYFFILYGKSYIYRTKKNKNLHLYESLMNCTTHMEIKYEIMTEKGLMTKFILNWGDLYNSMS